MARSHRSSGMSTRTALGLTGAAAVAGLVYGTVIERHNFAIRTAEVPLLAPGNEPLRLLHISDIHMLPRQHLKQSFINALADLHPDIVINTGDNLSSTEAVPALIQALDPLLALPGAFVFGSNDYFAPIPKNPLSYVGLGKKRHSDIPLPWRDMRAAFTEHGWEDVTHRRVTVTAGTARILIAGVDDPHIDQDDYALIAGPAGPGFDLRIGLTHSPEPRVLDAFDADGYDLALAGHTHGGQICLPTGAIITNSGLDRSRVKGLSAWGRHLVLHVSAGLGNSPFVPVRTFCRPEAALLTLTPRRPKPHDAPAVPHPQERTQPLLAV